MRALMILLALSLLAACGPIQDSAPVPAQACPPVQCPIPTPTPTVIQGQGSGCFWGPCPGPQPWPSPFPIQTGAAHE